MQVGFVRRPGFWAAAVPLAALLLGSLLGHGGFLELLELRRERLSVAEEVYRLLRENEGLRRQILRLRRSDRDLERLARQKLGLVRDHEIVYRFRAPDDSLASR